MGRLALLNKILEGKIVAIIRTKHPDVYLHLAEALQKAGLTAVEVSLTSVNALSAIEALAKQFGNHMQIGVGSVLDTESANRAVEAGAQYIVTPITKPEIIYAAHRYSLPIFSGAFSPGEILQAHELGADVVKVFPADVLGIGYLKALKAPMPQLQLMPTGGVTLQNVGDWFKAGACAVGIAGSLFNEELLLAKDYKKITEKAIAFKNALD
ncbi:MAG: bifunctional 4-hydroxy-2-oxoglutarate aldolase/2-dehydro-3-deoxy-phosphogluconate aldolase [Bacteroidota bacterium]